MATSSTPEGLPTRSVPLVFLHIGTMKSGTTYLQKVLVDHKERLAADGYLFPGASWKAQVRAAQDATRTWIRDPRFRAEARGAWQALATEMTDHAGTASLVSMEFLADARPGQVRAIASSLERAEVHVLLTVRDATRIVPSHWQTFVKSKGTIGWHEFGTGVRKAAGIEARLWRFSNRPAAEFRRVHDVARVLDAWGRTIPAERLHVVTVPRSRADPMLLWRRFAEVVGLDRDLGAGISPANESLGYASTELLRRVNLALDDVPLHDHFAIVREHLGNRILSQRSEQEVKPRLDQATFDFALGWNARTREAVARSGARLVGDLEDLPTAATEQHSGIVDDAQALPTDEELLAAASAALDGMRALTDRQRRRAARRGLAIGPEQSHRPDPSAGPSDPVGAVVAEIASLCRTAIDLRRRLRS